MDGRDDLDNLDDADDVTMDGAFRDVKRWDRVEGHPTLRVMV